jgi:hypothetical protein
MPLRKGKKNVGSNIKEFHKGPTYLRTKKKLGKKTADKQAVAASMSAAGVGKKKKKPAKKSKSERNKSEAEQ